MGRAGLNRKTALATATLTLAAEAPDLDVFSRFGGSAFGLNHHRGFTHSFLGVPLVAAAGRRIRLSPLALARPQDAATPIFLRAGDCSFAYACLAGLSHILLDFTNNYGVRPFWPFSERWISWDIVFIVEPVLLVVLTLGPDCSRIVFAHQRRDRRPRQKARTPSHRETGSDSRSARRLRVLGTARLRASPRRGRARGAQLPGSRCHSRLRISLHDQSVSLARSSGNARFLRHHGRRFAGFSTPEVDPAGPNADSL